MIASSRHLEHYDELTTSLEADTACFSPRNDILILLFRHVAIDLSAIPRWRDRSSLTQPANPVLYFVR